MLLSGDLTQTFIATARLTMAAFKPADARESFIEANDRIARFMSWNPPESEDAYGAIWRASLADMKIGRQLSLVIRVANTNEFIGSAGLQPADDLLLETGVWIKTTAQRKGFGREAVAGVIAWASDAFHPSGFLWPVVDENMPSRALAESLGGKVIGSRQRQKPGDAERTLLLYVIPPTRTANS